MRAGTGRGQPGTPQQVFERAREGSIVGWRARPGTIDRWAAENPDLEFRYVPGVPRGRMTRVFVSLRRTY